MTRNICIVHIFYPVGGGGGPGGGGTGGGGGIAIFTPPRYY